MPITREIAPLPPSLARRLRAIGGWVWWSLALPLGAALATLRFLVPARLDGGPGGVSALLARLGDEQPLLVAVVLLLAFSATIKHWRRDRLRTELEVRPRRAVPLLLALLATTIVVRAFVVEGYRVVGPSMLPTLTDGDRVVVNRLAYGLRIPFSPRIVGGKLPRRGDIIVFGGDRAREGGGDGPSAAVKRVIGLPGDVVAFRGGSAVVNGWPVPACDAGPFVTMSAGATVRGRLAVERLDDAVYLTIRTPLDDAAFAGYKVPAGELFVLGDDRGLSRDSRSWNGGRGGAVRLSDVRGRISRLAVGRRPDGGLDLARLFRPLDLQPRLPNVDLRETEALIAACLARPPARTRPPAPP